MEKHLVAVAYNVGPYQGWLKNCLINSIVIVL